MGYAIKEYKGGEEQALHVLKMFAEGFKIGEICESMQLSFAVVNGICKEEGNKEFLDQYRKNYMARVMDVPIANKRIRVDDLEKTRKRLLSCLDKLQDTDIKENCNVIRQLVAVLERAQNEMEQRPMLIAQIVSGYNDFGALNDDQLFEQREKLLALAQRSLLENRLNNAIIDVESEKNDN